MGSRQRRKPQSCCSRFSLFFFLLAVCNKYRLKMICAGVSAHIKITQYISIFVTLRTPAPMKTGAMLAVRVIAGTRSMDQQQTHAYLRLLVIWIFHSVKERNKENEDLSSMAQHFR